MSTSAGIFEIPVGGARDVSIDWSDWLESLPSGQTLDAVSAPTADGSDGNITNPYNPSLVGNISTHYFNAESAFVGVYLFKITATSNGTPPVPDFKGPRWLTIKVLPRAFVEEV